MPPLGRIKVVSEQAEVEVELDCKKRGSKEGLSRQVRPRSSTG